MEAEAARAERASALEPVPAPDHLRYGGLTQAPLVRQLFAGLVGAGAGGTAAAANLTDATGGPHARGAAGNIISSGGVGRGVAGSRAIDGMGGGGGAAAKGVGALRPGGGVEGGRGIGVGGGGGSRKQQRLVGDAAPASSDVRRRPLGGSGDHYADGFASTLEHHRRNVIAITVPPVQAVGTGGGGVAPETLTRGGGRGGRSEGSGRGNKPESV